MRPDQVFRPHESSMPDLTPQPLDAPASDLQKKALKAELAALALLLSARVAPRMAAPIAKWGFGVELGAAGEVIGVAPLAATNLLPQPFGFTPAEAFGLAPNFYLPPGIGGLPEFIPGAKEQNALQKSRNTRPVFETRSSDEEIAAAAAQNFAPDRLSQLIAQMQGGYNPFGFRNLAVGRRLLQIELDKSLAQQPKAPPLQNTAQPDLSREHALAPPGVPTTPLPRQFEYPFFSSDVPLTTQRQIEMLYAMANSSDRGIHLIIKGRQQEFLDRLNFLREVRAAELAVIRAFTPFPVVDEQGREIVDNPQGPTQQPGSVNPIAYAPFGANYPSTSPEELGRVRRRGPDGRFVPGSEPAIPLSTRPPGDTPGQAEWNLPKVPPSAQFPDNFFAHLHGDP